MNEISYFLGAGASCYSMPLVSSFVERFKIFQQFIRFSSDIDNGKKLDQHCGEFIDDVENHLSFDTFFKKLFHQDKIDLILLYKKVLLLYFIYEHLVEPDSKKASHPLKALGKEKNLDPRYDAVIAGLLQPIKGESHFFTNINFITWNYDLNLFVALRNFLFPDIALNSLFKSLAKTDRYFKFSEQCSLIHLNGIVYHPQLNEIKPISNLELQSTFASLIGDFYGYNSSLNGLVSHINFAWEYADCNDVIDTLSFIKRAQECIEKSKQIVIIGYSFPLYNRLIDLSIFNSKSLEGKTIYIQDPEAEILKSTFAEGFSLDFEDHTSQIYCETIKECKAFFVPKDVFVSLQD